MNRDILQKNNLKAPQLRFADFDGVWEEKRLKQIGKTYNGLAGKSGTDFGSGEPFITYKQIFDKSEINVNGFGFVKIREDEKQNTVKFGDILFTTSSENPEEVGFSSAFLDKKTQPYLNSFSFGFRPDSTQIDSYFAKHFFRSSAFRKEMIKLAQGSTRYNISKDGFLKIKLPFPTYQEQQKIALFLEAIDSWLDNLQTQKQSLELYKKGVMQKIFAQEIRFKDKDGNPYPVWKKKKLSSFMKERNEKAPKSDQYPLMAFVARVGVTPKGDRYNREFLVSDSEGKDYKRTERGDFIYSSNNLETGSIGLNRYGSASISPVYGIFSIADSCDYEFIGNYLTRKSFINKMIRFRQGVVYGQWRIHESDFLNIEEEIPCIDEQKKIADYLGSIDQIIEAKERQIVYASQWKKALMQKLFI